jgi:hypothetical protein
LPRRTHACKAWEAFDITQEDVYGCPPLSKGETQYLDDGYVKQAKTDVALQFSRAGVRLAFLLNSALR